jgi:hypothetical protein
MKTYPTRPFPVKDRWCVHSYYTVCPYAPDGSGYILAAGADLERGTGEVLVLSPDGEVLDRFGEHPLHGGFYHTGWWQTWSPDARYVYYQAGSLKEPRIGRRDLSTGTDIFVEGDMEGAPPTGEPIISGLLGMLYAAGYGDRRYKPEAAPVPFQARDRHGIFEYGLDPPGQRLRLSVAEIFRHNIDRARIQASDEEIKRHLGPDDGLTLMAYCVRWSPDGSRFLFNFGNHCVVKDRNEPRIAQVITTDREMKTFHTALDLGYGKRGVHWSWQPDNEHLIGYAEHPEDPSRRCLAEVRYDGSGWRMISEHGSGGHPSVSPTDPDLIVTDEEAPGGGAVVFISKRSGEIIGRVPLPKYIGSSEPPGRNPLRVCHHPVFNSDGKRVLCNSLPGKYSTLIEITVHS